MKLLWNKERTLVALDFSCSLELGSGAGGCRGGSKGRQLRKHLYGARLTLHKKLNSKSCSSRDSPCTVVLGFSIFDPVRILRPRRSPTMHGHPSTHRRSGASIGLLLRQKVENCKDNGYLKMAPCDSPSETGIETNLSGLNPSMVTHPYIWKLVVVTDVTDVTDRHFQKSSRPPFYATF